MLKQSEERNRELEAQNLMLHEQFATLQTYTKMQGTMSVYEYELHQICIYTVYFTVIQLWWFIHIPQSDIADRL